MFIFLVITAEYVSVGRTGTQANGSYTSSRLQNVCRINSVVAMDVGVRRNAWLHHGRCSKSAVCMELSTGHSTMFMQLPAGLITLKTEGCM